MNANYTIMAINKCSCGLISFDISLFLLDQNGKCACGKTTPSNNIWWIASNLFRPINNQIIPNKDIIKNIIEEIIDAPINHISPPTLNK